MDAERWRRVEELYHAASGLPVDDRRAFLDRSCSGDPALRSEVESLLTYETSSGPFIESPALDVAARLMARDPSHAVPSLIGTTIGHFEVLGKLGEGGMGVVYEALDTRLGRKVALKFLPAMVVSNAKALERFAREARAASALNHPNICTIYSVQEADGQPFIEMERLEGRTLRERIGHQPLETREVVSLALQIVDGLAAAHAQGIVHRDLKPGNIFCTERGTAKILDFGVAKRESAPDADAGLVVGTPSYMSPEQASGGAVDARTDLFSLGAVMYEMATGCAAFQGSVEPAPPRRVNPRIPPALERIILKALSKVREERYQRADQLRTDLERLRQHAARRRQLSLTAGVVLLVLLAGAAAFWYAGVAPGDMFTTNFRLRQITHNAGEFGVTSGAISPDGRYVAYSDARGMHVHTVETGATRRIPQSENPPSRTAWDLSPGWLPDGTGLVANLVSEEGIAASSVWMVAVGGEPRKLRDHARALSVSPDGSWIAFATDSTGLGDRDMWVMSPDGRSVRKLFDADAGYWTLGLSWSPDARRVAYLRADDTRATVTIETRAFAGGPASTLLRPEDSSELHGFAWLRDGRLLYSLRRAATGTTGGTVACSHWQMRLDATGRPLGAARPLAGWLPECPAAVSFTANSTQALYLHSALQDTIHAADLDAGGHLVAPPARVTSTDGRNIPSGWTSDGRAIVLVSDGAGRPALFRQPVDGDTPQLIADEPGIVGAARLTPDGASIVYLSLPRWRSAAGLYRLMRVPLAGGVSREVLTGTFVDGGARCTGLPANLCVVAERTEDGRQLVFTSIDVAGGRGRELARFDAGAGGVYRWALAPDGARIAVLDARQPAIRILSTTGLPPREFQVKGTNTLGYVSWTSDGTRLIAPSVDARGATLLSIDLQGDTYPLWQQPGALDISGIPSPDGRHVAIWIRGRKSNLWLAESPQ